MTIASRFDRYLGARVVFDGRERELRLRVPTAADLVLLLPPEVRGNAELEMNAVSLWISNVVESMDGAPLTRDQRRALAADPAARVTVLKGREALLDALRFDGRCYLRCPHCGAGEVELDTLGLSVGLRTDPWPLADSSALPSPPSLSTLWPRGRRPAGAAVASAARLLLPARRAGLPAPFAEGAFGVPVDADSDAAAWRRWGLDGAPLVANREHQRYSNPGFRAILRLAVALERLDGMRDVTPDVVEGLPMCDLAFADAVYYLLHNVDVVDPDACTVTCPACGHRFLAVR